MTCSSLPKEKHDRKTIIKNSIKYNNIQCVMFFSLLIID